MDGLMFRSPAELAELVRSGELSATELTETSLQRIDELEPAINAFTHVAHESALAAAATISAEDPRPFAGVPIAIKDNRAVAGMPLTVCSDLFGDFVTPHDAYFVRRLREAGFVIVGKTALPEMGILPTTESRRHGPTRNPWDLERTPGGSSGGAAAAVAAGMVPIAHGNDGGGSTRIPAACCGLVGLKGARGRVSVGPDAGQSFLVIDGVLTRTVADTAELLDVMAGYETGDANWAPPAATAYADLAQSDPGALTIGLALNSPLEGATLDPVCERAARDAAALLESLGHHVEEITPPWSGLNLLPDFSRAFGPGVSFTTFIGGKLRGREPTEDDVEPLTWEMYTRAKAQDTLTYLSAQGRLESVARSIVAFLAPYDAVLTPALAQRQLRIGEVHGRGPDHWDHFQRSGLFTPYTAIVNVTGQPAISLPLYHGADGLPTAVQLIGRPAGEGGLLALATQLERALPWAGRRAQMSAVSG
jgi:amidase